MIKDISVTYLSILSKLATSRARSAADMLLMFACMAADTVLFAALTLLLTADMATGRLVLTDSLAADILFPTVDMTPGNLLLTVVLAADTLLDNNEVYELVTGCVSVFVEIESSKNMRILSREFPCLSNSVSASGSLKPVTEHISATASLLSAFSYIILNKINKGKEKEGWIKRHTPIS